jgi:hypothetical protein
MRFARHLSVAFLLTATALPSWAQGKRLQGGMPQPPQNPFRGLTQVPHDQRRKGFPEDDWDMRFVSGYVVLAWLACRVIRSSWKRPIRQAIIRIIATPPGEAPEFVRRAWVGLELPVVRGQTLPEMLTAQGVLSSQKQNPQPGYAVNGRAAIKILESACPEAAEW